MDVPGWPLESLDALPLPRPGGRGKGQTTQNVVATVELDSKGSESDSQPTLSGPLFRVKRWRKESTPSFVNPSPKANALTPKLLVT